MEDYNKTDKYIHWLCQTIAKANRTFVPEKSDESHTSLYFDRLGDRIVGRWIETEKGRIVLTLNFSTLRFKWLNSAYQVIASFSIIGKKITEVEQDIENHLTDFGLAKDGFTDKMHFEIPDYKYGMVPIQSIPVKHLENWKRIRNLANQTCSSLLGHLQIEGEIRIWPHHFDTGIYVTTNNEMGIGFGLAMSDGMVEGPYFYMSGYPSSNALEYQNLPEIPYGKWITGKNWNGAVLPLFELTDLSRREKHAIINDYMLTAVKWYLKQS